MRRPARGHTLVELLVVVTLMGLVLTFTTQATKPMTESTLKLRARAYRSSELRLAVESLLADMGGAKRVKPEGRSSLHIVREDAVAQAVGALERGKDKGILYTLRDDQLVREDLALDTVVLMARSLSGFEVVKDGKLGTRIGLSVGEGRDTTQVQLVWTY